MKPLITHRFTLDQTLDAFETARTGAGGAIKVVVSVLSPKKCCDWSVVINQGLSLIVTDNTIILALRL